MPRTHWKGPMTDNFKPEPDRCGDLACRRSSACRRPWAAACLTSPYNRAARRQALVEKLNAVLRESGEDPDAPPPPDAMPIEETLAMILEEAARRRAAAARRKPAVASRSGSSSRRKSL